MPAILNAYASLVAKPAELDGVLPAGEEGARAAPVSAPLELS